MTEKADPFAIHLSPRAERWIADGEATREELEKNARQLLNYFNIPFFRTPTLNRWPFDEKHAADLTQDMLTKAREHKLDVEAEVSPVDGQSRSALGMCFWYASGGGGRGLLSGLLPYIDVNGYDSSGVSLLHRALLGHSAWTLKEDPRMDFDRPLRRGEHASPIEFYAERYRNPPGESDFENGEIRRSAMRSIDELASCGATIPPDIIADRLVVLKFEDRQLWQKEWDRVERNLKKSPRRPADTRKLVEFLSPERLKHFYTLGHLGELLQQEHWRGNEGLILDKLLPLPECITNKFSIEIEALTELSGRRGADSPAGPVQVPVAEAGRVDVDPARRRG